LIAILLERGHGYEVGIDSLIAATALRASSALPGEYPAKLVSLLDAAVANAAAAGATVLAPDDIYATARLCRAIQGPEISD
jgi:hypothetical protein